MINLKVPGPCHRLSGTSPPQRARYLHLRSGEPRSAAEVPVPHAKSALPVGRRPVSVGPSRRAGPRRASLPRPPAGLPAHASDRRRPPARRGRAALGPARDLPRSARRKARTSAAASTPRPTPRSPPTTSRRCGRWSTPPSSRTPPVRSAPRWRQLGMRTERPPRRRARVAPDADDGARRRGPGRRPGEGGAPAAFLGLPLPPRLTL